MSDSMFCNLGKKMSPYIGDLGKGVHSYRIFNIAYIDVIVVVLGAIGISYLVKIPAWIAIIGMLILGIVVHKLLCIRTTVDKLLFN